MLIAGHDTSTALLAWCLFLLGSHPDVQAQVRGEIDTVLRDQEEPPSIEQLNRLSLLDLVIKETLRLYPPIHVGIRRAAEDLTICGYHVPQGSRLMNSIYLSTATKNTGLAHITSSRCVLLTRRKMSAFHSPISPSEVGRATVWRRLRPGGG